MKLAVNIKNSHWPVLLTLLVMAFILYWPSLAVGFLSDDWHALFIAREHSDWWRFFATNIVGERLGSSYGPMWNLLIDIEYSLFRLHSVWYHAVSLFLLAGTGFVLHLLSYRLTKNRVLAIFAGIIFIFIPSHVEAVAWISGQPHLLATLLFVFSLYAYLVFIQERKKQWYALALVATTLSLLTKEIGITVVAGFVLLDIFFADKKLGWKKYTRQLFLRLFLPIALVITYILARQYATGVLFGYYGAPSLAHDPYQLIRMFIEIETSLFFSWPNRLRVLEAVSVHLPLFLFFVFLVLWFVARKTAYIKAWVWLVMMYVIATLPYLTLQFSALGNEGERYTYLPSLFVALAGAFIFNIFYSRGRFFMRCGLTLFAGVLIFFTLGIQDKLQNWSAAGTRSSIVFRDMMWLNVQSGDKIIIVGAPDNLLGAQMFRNGFGEMLALRGYSSPTVERVPLFIFLTPLTVESDLVRVEEKNKKIIFSGIGEQRIFSGLPVYRGETGEWKLSNFRHSDQTGTAIEFTPNSEFKNRRIIYWNSGHFQAVKL